MESFTEEEASILVQYGAAFQRLTSGERKPETEAQKRFIKVARGQCSPVTKYERAWRKYLDQSDFSPMKTFSSILSLITENSIEQTPNVPFKSSKSKPNKKKKKRTKLNPEQGKKVYPNISDIINPHNGPWKEKAILGSNEAVKKNSGGSKYDG
jgi:uncharacterized protein YifE (UPF0438 family)